MSLILFLTDIWTIKEETPNAFSTDGKRTLSFVTHLTLLHKRNRKHPKLRKPKHVFVFTKSPSVSTPVILSHKVPLFSLGVSRI